MFITTKRVIIISLIISFVIIVGGFFGIYFIFSEKKITKNTVIPREEADFFNFYSWWTSPGEFLVHNALVDAFSDLYPETVITSSFISRGDSPSMFETVGPLIRSGESPDSFLMHAGYEGMSYYQAGLLEPVDDIWRLEKLEEVVPTVVQDMNKFNGHYYSVPIDIHRVNIVWYNKRILDKFNIDVENLDTWVDFFEACSVLREEGIEYPVQIGEAWTIAHAFEQFVASEGIDFYQDWANGEVDDENNERLIRVFNNFDKYLSYANPDYEDVAWDEMVDRIIEEEGVFVVMGDWANQEFKIAKKWYGVDYGNFTVPGTNNFYGLAIDAFQRPKNISHRKNTNRWLKLVSSREVQDIFNPLKGSISVRTDVDISRYDNYQKSSIADFWKSKYMFPSVVHGSGAPESFKKELNKIMLDFIEKRDVYEATSQMTSFVYSINNEYVISWSLK